MLRMQPNIRTKITVDIKDFHEQLLIADGRRCCYFALEKLRLLFFLVILLFRVQTHTHTPNEKKRNSKLDRQPHRRCLHIIRSPGSHPEHPTHSLVKAPKQGQQLQYPAQSTNAAYPTLHNSHHHHHQQLPTPPPRTHNHPSTKSSPLQPGLSALFSPQLPKNNNKK